MVEEGEGRRVGMQRKGCRRGHGGDGGRRTRRFSMEKDVAWGCSGEGGVGESAGRWPDVLKINELFVDKYKKKTYFCNAKLSNAPTGCGLGVHIHWVGE